MPSNSAESASGPANAELLAAALRGEREAWNGLVERFGRLVWSVARSFELPASDAADLSQTVWLRLVEHLDQIKEPDRLGSWLATTTRREGIKLLRRRSLEIPDEHQEEQSDQGKDGPEEHALVADEYAQLREALAKLPEHCRKLLRVIAASDEANYKEVAAVLEMPVGSIGPTRSRCLERLRVQYTQPS
jgi:RNA polymerase sigma factor (sigma-70 family)